MQKAGSVARALAPVLDPLQKHIAGADSRIVPSAFVGDDEHLRAFPLPTDWKWATLPAYLRAFQAEVLVSQIPSFWQLEPYIFSAARDVQVPLITIDPENYPLVMASLLYAGTTTVLTVPGEAERLVSYLRSADTPLPHNFVLVHAADAPGFSLPPSLKNAGSFVAHEVHIVPGVPLLVQCTEICKRGVLEFHFADIFEWNEDTAAPRVRSRALPFQIEDFTLPFSLHAGGSCACGKPLLHVGS